MGGKVTRGLLARIHGYGLLVVILACLLGVSPLRHALNELLRELRLAGADAGSSVALLVPLGPLLLLWVPWLAIFLRKRGRGDEETSGESGGGAALLREGLRERRQVSLTLAGFALASLAIILTGAGRSAALNESAVVALYLTLGFFLAAFCCLRFVPTRGWHFVSDGLLDSGLWCGLVGLFFLLDAGKTFDRPRLVMAVLWVALWVCVWEHLAASCLHGLGYALVTDEPAAQDDSTVGPDAPAESSSVMAYHTKNDPTVYHMCKNCAAGNNIARGNLVAGVPAGARPCTVCIELQGKGQCTPGAPSPGP